MLILGASLSFSGVDWLWPLVAGCALAAALVLWSYWRSPAPPAVRLASALLKLLGIAALAFCLLEPLWNRTRARPGANYFVVLADNSQGMRIKDHNAPAARHELASELLSGANSGWQDSLAETFRLRRYFFDVRLQSTDNYTQLDFNGGASSLIGALRSVQERYRGQPLAGVIVLTDGNATDVPDALDLSGVPPVYPVAMGQDDPLRDISLRQLSVSQTAFEDAPVQVQADIVAEGFEGESLSVQLLDVNGRVVETQTDRVAGQPLAFRFRVRPEKRGLSFYQVRAAATSSTGVETNEATLANNARAAVVDRGRGPYRILYVAGRPNWEFKFLNRALAEEDQLELVALIRIARREPKFEFIGRQGESANPLFRGFGQTGEETERYDQPVLTRLNTRDEFELKGGFPKTAEELYSYDAIIMDDLEAEFFTRDQMTLVQKFVSERGGGFLMLGGADSFREGNYARTPVGDMLPVYLDRPGVIKTPMEWKLALTREGLLQPWTRVRDNEADERERLADMPPFQVLNDAAHVKPGASVLATVGSSDGQTFPALVAQRFGNGRTGALLVGDLWRWGMRDESMRRDMDKSWRQMMRWLVTDVPARIELRVANKQSDAALGLEVLVRDKDFQPLENATVHIQVAPAQGGTNATNSVRLAAEPSSTERGTYVASYLPRQAGAYRAEAIVLDANGAEVGRAETGWASDPAAEEFRSLKPNRALLEQIARQTGGRVLAAKNLPDFAKQAPNERAPVTEAVAIPLWHTPFIFLFALICFVAEWGLRRWKGLP